MSIHRAHTSYMWAVLQLILMAWLFSGCAGSKGSSASAPPPWVAERPLSPSHYIGIGSAAFHEGQEAAMETAKKRAAADLASEIAVKVESASLLESAETNGQVSEEFSSSISSRAEERITGFEVMDVWSDKERVHVYYRLNKARHATLREARRQEALAAAVIEYEAGRDILEEEGMVLMALSHWSRGIMALEEFWNESNRAVIGDAEVNLESHLLTAMRSTIQGIRIQPAVDEVVLTAAGRFKFPLGLHATLDGRSMASVPLAYQYHNGTYRKSGTEFTDGEGMVVAIVSGVKPNRPDTDFRAGIDLGRMWRQAEVDPTVASLCGEPVTHRVALPVRVEMPRIFIGVDPASPLAAELIGGPIQSMRGVLMDDGFTVVDKADEAEFTVLFNLRSEVRPPVSDLGNFHTAYIEGSVIVRDADGNRVDEERINRTKGVQLSAAAALNLALNNAAESIEKTLGNKVSAALQ